MHILIGAHVLFFNAKTMLFVLVHYHLICHILLHETSMFLFFVAQILCRINYRVKKYLGLIFLYLHLLS